MKLFNARSFLTAAVAAAALVILVAPALADDAEDDDIYVAPLDENGSDEQLREEAGSGFDTPGPVYIDEDDYDAGARDDGTWAPDAPAAADPESAEDDSSETSDEGN